MIDKILKRPEFTSNPPILVDIGASGEIHAKWKKIAKYSVCVAFDADDREMNFTENNSSGFKKLITINRIVTDKPDGEVDFYLTHSPFCSSALEPNIERLSIWPFQNLFQIERKIKLKAVRLDDALKNVGITNIDWLKIDTQGTDLRIFKSLQDSIRKNLLVAEFEPGIIDAYKGEDKLHELIAYMTGTDFFMSSLEVKGIQRITFETATSFNLQHRTFARTHEISPGWAEVCYMNNLDSTQVTIRSYLLAYAFALIERQYAFALEISLVGSKKTDDKIFTELKDYARKKILMDQIKWPIFGFKNKMKKAFNWLFR